MKMTDIFLTLKNKDVIERIENFFGGGVKLAKPKREENNLYFLIDTENNSSLLEIAELSAKLQEYLESDDENIFVRNVRMCNIGFINDQFIDFVDFSKENCEGVSIFLEKNYLNKEENKKYDSFSFKNMPVSSLFSNEKEQPTLTSPREIIKEKLKKALSKTLSEELTEEDKENIKKMSPEEIQDLGQDLGKDYSTELLNIIKSKPLKMQ